MCLRNQSRSAVGRQDARAAQGAHCNLCLRGCVFGRMLGFCRGVFGMGGRGGYRTGERGRAGADRTTADDIVQP